MAWVMIKEMTPSVASTIIPDPGNNPTAKRMKINAAKMATDFGRSFFRLILEVLSW